MSEKKPIYCHFAFKNIHIDVDGTSRPCCEYPKTDNKYNLKNHSLTEIFHQPALNAVRNDLRNGIEHKNCDICFRREKMGKKSPRQLANLIHRDEGGMDDPKISSMTFSLGNLCNLACRTCGPKYSSKWFNEYYDLYWSKDNHSRQEKLVENKNNRSINDTLVLSKFDKSILKNLNELKFYGGEPLLDNSMWEICETLVNLGLSKNIILHYNTNCTIIPSKAQQETWRQFKKIFLNLSIDGVEKQFEYLRHGASWAQVEANVKEFITIKNDLKNMQLNQILTVSSINIFDIDQTIDFYIKNFSNDMKLYTNNVTSPSYFSFRSVPDQVKNEISQKLRKLSTSIKNIEFVSNIRSLDNFLKETSFDKGSLKEMLETLERHDTYRQQDFKSYFPQWSELLYNS